MKSSNALKRLAAEAREKEAREKEAYMRYDHTYTLDEALHQDLYRFTRTLQAYLQLTEGPALVRQELDTVATLLEKLLIHFPPPEKR